MENVLFVCKDKIINKEITQVLKEYYLIYCSDSQSAILNLNQSDTISFVLLSVEIGAIDGWRLARLIRSGVLTVNKDIPIIIITDHDRYVVDEITAKLFEINTILSLNDLRENPQLIVQSIDAIQPSFLPTLLIIEDAKDISDLVQKGLTRYFQADVAETGQEAKKMLSKNQYDLVLLDYMLPDTNGLELQQYILTHYPEQKIIANTAYSSATLATQFILDGAIDFIPKPFRIDAVRNICTGAVYREELVSMQKKVNQKLFNLNAIKANIDLESVIARIIIDHINHTVFVCSDQGNIVFLNSHYQAETGFQCEDQIGKHISYIIQFNDTDTFDSVKAKETSIQLTYKSAPHITSKPIHFALLKFDVANELYYLFHAAMTTKTQP